MRKVNIKSLAGVGVLSLGLVFGMAGFAGAEDGSGSIHTTGPDSTNKIKSKSEVNVDYTNDNDLNLRNEAEQNASSGEAEAEHNTTAGNATSGSAMNANTVSANITVDNDSAAAWAASVSAPATQNFDASIENTGPDSTNIVRAKSETNVSVENNNDICLTNEVSQSAHSGEAEVEGNTTGGNATSGNVSNTSSSSFTVRVSN